MEAQECPERYAESKWRACPNLNPVDMWFTFCGGSNGAKSRDDMSFTSSDTSNAAFGQQLNASFGSTCSSRTVKLNKLKQSLTSLGKDCQK